MYNIEPEEREKFIKTALGQYKLAVENLENTRETLRKRLNPDKTRMYSDEAIEKQDSIILLKESVEQAKEQYAGLGGDINDLEAPKSKNQKAVIKDNDVMTMLKEMGKENNTNDIKKENKDVMRMTQINVERPYIPTMDNDDNPTASFDLIPLPSRGECYKGKYETIPVEYLTAIDENIIINPNLYNNNKVIDYILKAKIRDKSIDPDDLLEGDRDAIILYLRSSAYGNEYPIIATDDITGEKFKTTIDLSKLKYKDFVLKSDENGWFDYTLPVSNAEVKFRFLTHRDNVILGKLDERESKKLKKNRLSVLAEELNFLVENDDEIESENKIKMRQAVRDLEDWRDSIDDSDAFEYTHKVSNELEYSIMEINGNRDRAYIHEFMKNMKIKDSTELRKYIAKNMPGIKYELEIEKPASLGGGSMKFFPKFDQFIFLFNS